MNKKNIPLVLMTAGVITLSASCSYLPTTRQATEPLDVLSPPLNAFFIESSPSVFSLDDDVLTSIVSTQRGFIGSKDSFQDFELTLEFWTDEGANSGVYIRCQESGVYSSRSCYEVNIADMHAVEASRTGSIVDFSAPQVELKTAGKWTPMKIVADGDHLLVTVDGITTVDIKDDSYQRGYLALQYGGNEKLIKFRDIRLFKL